MGRNRGLWAFHRDHMAREARGVAAAAEAEAGRARARAAGGLAGLALAGSVGDGTEAPVFYTNLELVAVARPPAAHTSPYYKHVPAV